MGFASEFCEDIAAARKISGMLRLPCEAFACGVGGADLLASLRCGDIQDDPGDCAGLVVPGGVGSEACREDVGQVGGEC